MAILVRCPNTGCKKYQSAKNKRCKCGEDLDAAKRAKKIRYSIAYRDPNGKQKKKSLNKLGLNPYSIKDAQDANAKIKVEKRENNKFFDLPPDTELTFKQLSKWYLKQEPVKELASFYIIEKKLDIFNSFFGDKIVADIKPVDLQNFQIKRKKSGKRPATIDQDIAKVKAMISMAYENDKVSGNTFAVFQRVKKTLKKGEDVRDRILTPKEFKSLYENAENHAKTIIAMGYYTGMRKSEILKLTWNKVNLKDRTIKLEPEDTKDKEARVIPICDELYKILYNLPNRIQSAGKNNRVFLYKGKPIKGFTRSLKTACKDAKIKYGRFVDGGFIFHDLRHTFNTNMRKAGIDDTVIMDITGHSTRVMFTRYNTVDADDIKDASRRFSDFLSKSNVAHSVAPSRKTKNKKSFKPR
jgi:integrase